MGRISLSLPWLLLMPAASFATDVDLFDVSLRQLMNITVEGATMTQETVSTAPSALTVFDESFIQSLPVSYLYELLNYVPGVQSQRGSDSGFSFGYSIRGRRNGNQSKEVLLLMDGVVMNDPRTGAANGSARMMSVAQIERVEVIRGPGSALYGSGAYAGVINIVTRKQQNELRLEMGDIGKPSLIGLNSYISGAWQWDNYIHFISDDGEQYNLDDTFSSDSEDRIISEDPKQMLEWHGSVEYKQSRISLIYNDIKGDDFYSLENISNGVNFNRFIHRGVQLEHRHDWSSQFSSQFQLQYTSTEQHLDSQVTATGALNDPSLSNPASADPVIILALVEAEGYRLNWHNNWIKNEATSIQFGLDVLKNKTITSEAANNFDVIQLSVNQFPVDYFGDFSQISAADPQDPQNMLGVYGQAIHQVNDTHKLNLGLRYDHNDAIEGHWSPRLGWVMSVDDNSAVKILLGQAFRAASLSEMSNPDSPILRGNPNLGHEKIETLDLIYLYQQSDLNLQAGMYYNHYDDPIIITLNNENIRQYVNGDTSESYGLEFEMNFEITDDTWLRISASELLESPKSFFRESNRTGTVMLNRFIGKASWNVTAVYKSESETEVTNGVFSNIDSAWLIAGKIKYQHSEKIESQLQIKNMLDKQYKSAPQGNGLQEGIPNRGAEFTYTFTYSY